MYLGRRALVQSKTARDRTKTELEGKFTYQMKKLYHLFTSHMYALSSDIQSRAAGPRTE